MSHTRETVERYRLIARAGCRVVAVLCAAYAALFIGHAAIGVAVGLLFTGFRGVSIQSFITDHYFREMASWLVVAYLFWRFDQRLARWIVPEPKRGGCPQCGYSLQGLGDRPICPECGADLRPQDARAH